MQTSHLYTLPQNIWTLNHTKTLAFHSWTPLLAFNAANTMDFMDKGLFTGQNATGIFRFSVSVFRNYHQQMDQSTFQLSSTLKNKEHLQKEVKTNASGHMWEAYRD